MTLDACVSRLQADMGLSEDEARQVVDMLAQEKRRLAAQKKLDNAERQLGEYAQRIAREQEIEAALKRKQAALAVLKRNDLDRFVGEFVDATGDRREALLAMMVGSPHKRAPRAVASAAIRQKSLLNGWMNSMEADLKSVDGAFVAIRKDREFGQRVIREIMEPGTTKDAQASRVGEILSKHMEDARQRLNRAGAFIRKLDGYVPQSHDGEKLVRVGAEKWAADIAPLLDVERSFPGVEQGDVHRILLDIYETIVTGRGHEVTGGERGEFIGPRNLARSMGKRRELHFNSADDWIKYHEAYGRGNLLDAVIGHMSMAARKLGLMEVFGPNPESMVQSILEEQRRLIRENKSLAPEAKVKELRRLGGDFAKRQGAIGESFSQITGEMNSPVNYTAARIGAGIRALQGTAKLGGATLSAVADVAIAAAAQRSMGKSIFSAWHDAFAQFTKMRGQKGKEIVRQLGVVADNMLRDGALRYDGVEDFAGVAAVLQDKFHRLSGLTPWTNQGKAGFAMSFANEIAENAGRALGDMPEPLRVIFERNGFGEREWDAIRAATKAIDDDGRSYLTPEAMRDLPNSVIDDLASERIEQIRRSKRGSIEAVRAATRQDLETRYRAMMIEETRNAIIEPDERTMAFMRQGTRPGTLTGEALRYAMQFKSFPLAYWQRVVRPQRWRQPGRGADISGIASHIVGSMVLGYVAMSAKDIAKGMTPRDPLKVDTFMAALVQSGGAGIYGDFLFGQYSRFGNTAMETAAGPALGEAASAINMLTKARRGEVDLGDAVQLVQGNLPMINLWYTRAALDYMILYHVREMLAPGTLKRMEKRRKEEWGQEFIVAPSSVIKRGGGFK